MRWGFTVDTRSVHAHLAGGQTLIVVGGELGLAYLSRLRAALRAALENRPPRVVVDLGGVSRLDPAVVGVLDRARGVAEEYGGGLRLTAAHGQVLETLEVLGLAKDLGAYEPSVTTPELPCCRPQPVRDHGTVATPEPVDGLPNEAVHALLTEAAALPERDPHRQSLLHRATEVALPAAYRFASRYRCRGETDDDLLQVAALGLVKAVHRYDPRRGHRFHDYAVPTILGELRRHFRDSGSWVRVPRPVQELWLDARGVADELSQRLGRQPSVADLAARLGVPKAAVATAMHAARSYAPRELPAGEPGAELVERLAGDDPGYDRIENWATVRSYLPRLPERTRQILTLRFVHDMSQREIAAEVGLSQVHVSRLLTQAYNLLRAVLLQDRPALGRERRAGA